MNPVSFFCKATRPNPATSEPSCSLQTERHFQHRLESFRGLAAVSVVIHHAFTFVRYDPSIGKYYRSIEAVFYGHGAVLSFFVLSGYVLGQSLRRQKTLGPINYLAFSVKRCFRILPAFVISIIFCYFLYFYSNLWKSPTTASSKNYLDYYNFTPGFSLFFKNLTFQSFDLNPVAWTLLPEILCSLLLPIFHLGSISKATRGALLFFLMVAGSFFKLSSNLLISAFAFSWIFYLGYLIPLIPETIWKWLTHHSYMIIVIVLTSIGVCLSVPHFGHNEMVYTFSVTIIISLIVGYPKTKLFSILDIPVVRSVGKLSYSLYLLHFPISYSIAGLMFKTFPSEIIYRHSIFFAMFLAAGSVLVTLPLSNLLFIYIESPFIELGKKFTRRLLSR